MANELRMLIPGADVLFIPIFSTRSYKTGEYDLGLDGNMARIVSKIIELKPRHATITIPGNYKNLDVWSKVLVRNHMIDDVTFIPCGAYGKNAYETRLEVDKFIKVYQDLEDMRWDPFDVVITEPNHFTLNCISSVFEPNSEVIYWCVASATSKGCPWFVKDFVEIDKEIAQKIPTECATKSQVEFLGGYSYFDCYSPFYRPEIDCYKTIFFPFRLTDENYKAKYFREIILNIRKRGINNFKVLYTDVNDSDIFKDDEVFTKVSGQKDVYLSILKSRPIIPYFEDSDILAHININEFAFYNCQVIMKKSESFPSHPGFTFVEKDEDFEEALIKLLTD